MSGLPFLGSRASAPRILGPWCVFFAVTYQRCRREPEVVSDEHASFHIILVSSGSEIFATEISPHQPPIGNLTGIGPGVVRCSSLCILVVVALTRPPECRRRDPAARDPPPAVALAASDCGGVRRALSDGRLLPRLQPPAGGAGRRLLHGGPGSPPATLATRRELLSV